MKSKPRLLALASGGGHWVQLQRLRPAFDDFETTYVSMFDGYSQAVSPARYYTVPDASRFHLRALFPVFTCALRILWKERPQAIVTTGSAPMLLFVLLGRVTGARTLWIDSIANSERMSTSGRLAKRFAHKTISQWETVAKLENVEHWGAVI